MKLRVRNLCVLFIVLIVASCKPKEDNLITNTILSGKIINPTDDIIRLIGNDYKKNISVQDDGTFSDTMYIKEGYFTISHNQEFSELYLKPGFVLHLNLDTKSFHESILYHGVGANENNFIADKVKTHAKELPPIPELFSLEEEEFVSTITNLKNAFETSMSSYEFDWDFYIKERKNISYDYISSIQKYERYHKHFTKKDSFKASEQLLTPMLFINMDYQEDFDMFSNYRDIIIWDFQKSLGENATSRATLEKIKTYKSQNIRNRLLEEIAHSITPTNPDGQALMDGIMAISTDEEFKSNLYNKYRNMKQLTPGFSSPKFTYNDSEGKVVSLDDFKGKLVYIDVWATWCGPCKKEVPFQKDLENYYRNKDVEFVSISIDKIKDHQKWLNKLQERNLNAVQLIADKDWSSDFIVSYAIEGIPRFILIDKEGNIISSDAARPSSGADIRALLDIHLNK